jgi:hypothetical protein
VTSDTGMAQLSVLSGLKEEGGLSITALDPASFASPPTPLRSDLGCTCHFLGTALASYCW